MSKFLLKHTEIFLIISTVIILVVLAGYFVVKVSSLAVIINKALSIGQSGQSQTHFDLETARSLNLRGLVP